MITELKTTGALKRSLTLEIPFEDAKPQYDAVLRELRTSQIRGFRPGKFPKGWIDKRFKARMTVEATDNLIPLYFGRALKELDLVTAGRPSLEEINFDRKKPLVAILSFEVAPTFVPLDYSQLKLEVKEAPSIPEEELEKQFEDLRIRESNFEAKAEEAVAEDKNLVLIDYELFSEEGSLIDKNEEVAFILGLDSQYTELQTHILGMKVGECKEVILEPKEDQDPKEEIPHKASLSLKELKIAVLPELDSEFFERFDCKSKEEVIQQMKDLRLKDFKREQFLQHSEQLETQLLSFYGEFELPEQVLEEEREALLERLKSKKLESKDSVKLLEETQEGKTEENEKSEQALENKESGEKTDSENEETEDEKLLKTLRLAFIRQFIAKEASIVLDQEEVKKRLIDLANLPFPKDFFSDEDRMEFFYQTISRSVLQEQIMGHVESQVLKDPS